MTFIGYNQTMILIESYLNLYEFDKKQDNRGTKAKLLQLNQTQFICLINFTNNKVGNQKN